MNRKIIPIILFVIILGSFFLHFFRINKIPPCLNADEASFGYNAYSILKTGKDEYGAFLPLRLKSFMDFKLPLYSYLSIPFIVLFGLNEFSIRLLNIFIGISFVPLVYFIAKELFENEYIALISAFLISVSPWILLLSKQAHEGVLCTFFILVAFYMFLKMLKKNTWLCFCILNLSLFFATFSYHTGRLFLALFIFLQVLVLYKKGKYTISSSKKIAQTIILMGVFIIPLLIDFMYGANRVVNLFFLNSPGLKLAVNQYRTEHNMKLIHNIVFEAVRDITNRYFSQFSTDFFVVRGDHNWRFGYDGIGLVTPVEYIFFFVGLYYFFVKKYTYRFLLLLLLLVSPIPNVLTWQDPSIFRVYITIFPFLFIVSYGFVQSISSITQSRLRYASVLILGSLFFFYLINSLDVLLLHYPKRAVVVRSWQCGYKELVDYVKDRYDQYDNVIVTSMYGQPYIFFLLYMKYDPAIYQKNSTISAPDKYGFGQIKSLDKIRFEFNYDKKLKRTMFVGIPEDFTNATDIDKRKLKRIQIGSELIFQIYEQD